MVPPGYTRGPILFMQPAGESHLLDRQLQYFWDDAGAYGARILLLALGVEGSDTAAKLQTRLREWELDTVTTLTVATRADALQSHQAAMDAATAILLLVDTPLAAAQMMGGTPLAQAIRRANAHGKAVGVYGAGSTVLCQHMIVPPPGAPTSGDLFFGPGLGLVNRLAVDTPRGDAAEARLAAAVACNPFLVAVSLAPGAGVAVYPDTTMECFGAGLVQIATAEERDGAAQVVTHTLAARSRYNFDSHMLLATEESDIPDDDGPVLTGF